MDIIDLEIHFDGKFQKSPYRKYVGGRIKMCKNYDVDILSYFELFDLAKEYATNQNMLGLYFRPYTRGQNAGYIKLNNDGDVMLMLKYGSEMDKKFEIYTEHKIGDNMEVEDNEESCDGISASLDNIYDSDEESLNVRKKTKILTGAW